MKNLLKVGALLLCATVGAQNLLPQNASDFESGMPESKVIKHMWLSKDFKVLPGAGRNGTAGLEMTLSEKTKR